MAELEPLALLARIVDAADVVLRRKRDDGLAERMDMGEAALTDLYEQAKRERQTPRDDRLVGDEAEMLARALQQIHWARLEHNPDREQRWILIAQSFLPWARTDLAKAQAAARQAV